MPDKACVSTSSVKNAFVTPSSLINGSALALMTMSLREYQPILLEPDSIECIPCRCVGQDHLVAFFQPAANLDRIDRRPAEGHLDPVGGHAVRAKPEQADGAEFLPERRTPDEQDVGKALEFNRAVHTQVGTGPPRQLAIERDVHGHRSTLDGGIDPGHMSGD